MATVANGAHYSLRDSQLFAGNDFLLGPVLMAISIQPTGGVVSHIFTIIGYKHYRNFVANYTNPEYKAAVAQLPQARQGSEIFRGLAITLVKYFSDLPTKVRQTVHEYHLQNEKTNAHKYDNWRVLPAAFESEHAAALAAQLYPVEEPKKLIEDFECALTARFLNWLDVDIVLRGGAYDNEEQLPQTITRLVNLFGERTCLPSARLQRAPSSFTHSKHKSLVQNQDPAALEREVQELVATERNYVSRMNRLMDEIVVPMRKSARDLSYGGNFPSENELAQLFPACLDEIVRANAVFADDVDDALERDGIEGVARVCLEHFPKFKRCYQEYLRTSPKFTQLFSQFSKRKSDLFYKSVEVVGEQQLKSWLIDPVQRLPRYSLYIDNMLNHVDVGSNVFMNLNRARDIISEICSLQQSDSAERSQTIKRLQGIIPTWPIHLKPKGRLITAVDFYEILPPYNNETAECIASILLLFPDCVVILRRPNSTSLFARGIIAEVDRPASMKISSASKKDGIDLAFAGWCDLQDTRFAESDGNRTVWMEHIVDLSDNWTKGGEAGYRKLALYNAYEGKAVKFTEEVAQARLERRCANDPKGLIGIRRMDADGTYTSTWGALWGNEFDGYRQASWKGKYVIFIGEQPGSLEGSLKAELEDGYEVVIGVEPSNAREVRLEIHALGVLRTVIVSDTDFWSSFSTIIRESFVEMSTMECDAGLRAPCIMSTNERLLRSFKVSYDGYNASRLTRRLRPGSPAKIFSSVFGTGSTQVGVGNSSPTKSSKPVLLVDQRTRLPPPGGKRIASGGASQQKITLVKDEREALEPSGLNMFMRLEKTVELYLNGLRSVMTGYGFNLMAVPDKKQPLPDVPFEKQCEAHKLYAGFVDFIRAEWTEKIGSLVGRKVLDGLFDIYGQYGRQDSWSEFQDQFSEALSDMTPQNRRAFKNLMVLCHDLTDDLADNPKAMLVPSFVNLLHLDDEEIDPESDGNINFDIEYVRMIFYIAHHSDTFFDETPRSHEASVESSPMKNGGVRRAQTVAAAGQALRKKFTYLGGSIRGDSHKLKADYGEGTVNRMASVLKNFSKRDKARLQASRSVDEVIGGTDTIRPLRPASSDRPLLQTTFQSPSKESITTPLETIVGSPIDDTRALTGLPPVRPRRKRRSSLSDLQPVKDAETVNLLDRNNPIYDRIPMRPSAPPPPDTSRGPVPIRKGSKTGGIRIGTPPVPPESPTPAPGSRRDQRERAMMFDRKENVSRNAVSRPAKPSSNQALRPTGSSHLRERISVERNFPTENDLALQREIREMNKIGEELRGGSQSRGAGSTAPSSVASSASSAYATSHPTSAASSSYDDYRRLHTRGSSSEISQDLKVAFEYRAELHNREEKIKDMEAEMARKDMEVQTLRAEVRRKDAGIAQREQAQKEQTQKEKLQRREADIAKIEAEYRKREETYKAEIRKRDEEISKKQAEFIRKADEHRAELRKRDKAMRNLNRLYDEINAEQDELYKRCNDEIEAIARASAAIGSGALGGNGQSDLYRTLQDSYTKEGVMRQEIIVLKRQLAKATAKNEQS